MGERRVRTWLAVPLWRRKEEKEEEFVFLLESIHLFSRISGVCRCFSSLYRVFRGSGAPPTIVNWEWTSTAGWGSGCRPPQWVRPSWRCGCPGRGYCPRDEASSWTRSAPISGRQTTQCHKYWTLYLFWGINNNKGDFSVCLPVCCHSLYSLVVWWGNQLFCPLQSDTGPYVLPIYPWLEPIPL